MQGRIAQTLALTAAGNALLRGHDVAGFWPDASVFQFTKQCEFVIVEGEDEKEAHRVVARDPLEWLTQLKGHALGLRLHAAPAIPQPGQMRHIEERVLVGLVGGGPRWLIEVVGTESSEIWEGFDRLGDRNDPGKKIWLSAYLLQGETDPQDFSFATLDAAERQLRDVLPKLALIADELKEADFAACFRDALAALDTPPAPNPFLAEFVRYGAFDERQQRLLQSILTAWVFGGMGSWNDVAAGPEYEQASEALFRTLVDAICTLANSTYRS